MDQREGCEASRCSTPPFTVYTALARLLHPDMSTLTPIEKRALEKLLDMASGYVLGFSNRTFEEFFLDTVGITIYDSRYDYGSGSKANRLRAFWSNEPDHTVAKAMSAMLEIIELDFNPDPVLLQKARAIVERLEGATAVDDLGAISPNLDDQDFEKLARSVHDSINAGEPEAGLDRLHTFVSRYVGVLAEAEGIALSREKPLHSVFGELVKALRARGAIETDMAERILKSTISTLEAFNQVRNERSFAHPNPLLGFDEALLIFRNVTSSIRFLKEVTSRRVDPAGQEAEDEDLPF